MQVRRVTKKTLEAEVASQSEEIKALNLRVKFWVKHADVMAALLRLRGSYTDDPSVLTLRSVADEFRKSAERPLPSEQLMADQLAVVAPLVKQFYEKEDALASLFRPRDLRIPTPMQPGGKFRAVANPGAFLNGSYSTAEKAEIKKATREIDAHLRRERKVKK